MKMKQTSPRQSYYVFEKHKFIIFAFITTFLAFFIFYDSKIINYTNTTNMPLLNQTNTITQPKNDSEKCDLFRGRWIGDDKGALYTNYSCPTIPLQKNCFLNGRKDTDFLNWRWKPEKCELPRFVPETFLSFVQGKTMAFIGDSLARNQMESLLCLLSTVETPKSIQNDTEKGEKIATWEFPKQKFTLMAIWSQFLVSATEQLINGSASGAFNLTLDEVDKIWSNKLPIIDYAIFSGGHWFFRPHYLYESGKLIGCIYCQKPNLTDLGPGPAIRKAIRSAFEEINNCKNCKKILAVLRTFSPQHFENGAWNAGGVCNRTRPADREELIGRDGSDWEFRKIQVGEIEIARKLGEESGNKFEIVDVTEMMLTRPDGHPGLHWGNPWMKGYSDCVHWCMPGPIDTWNELLLEVIKRSKGPLNWRLGENT